MASRTPGLVDPRPVAGPRGVPGRCGRALVAADRLLAPDRLRVYPVALVVVFAAIVVWSWVTQGGLAVLPDFAARWTAGRLVADGQWDVLYDPGVQSALQHKAIGPSESFSWFVSPPYVALVLVPFGLLPYPVAAGVWLVASAGAVALALHLLAPLAPPVLAARWRAVVLVVLASFPVLALLGGGQDTGWVLLAAVAGVRLLRSGHPVAAGAVLALTLGKPHLVFLLPVLLLVQHRWRALAAYVVTATAVVGAGVALVGPAGTRSWLAVLGGDRYAAGADVAQAWQGSSVGALVTSVVPAAWQPVVQGWTVPLGLLLCVPVLVVAARAPRSEPTTWWLVLLTQVLAAPHALGYDVVLAVPAVLALAATVWDARTRVLLATAYCLWWLAPPMVSREWPLSLVSSPWAVVPVVLLWWRLLRAAPVDGARGGSGRTAPATNSDLRVPTGDQTGDPVHRQPS